MSCWYSLNTTSIRRGPLVNLAKNIHLLSCLLSLQISESHPKLETECVILPKREGKFTFMVIAFPNIFYQIFLNLKTARKYKI